MAEVVFLPGFMQHADSWSPIAAAVSERYPVKCLDFTTWTFEERLAEIRAAGQRRVLVGYSMGGRLALHAAVRWPDEFAALVTLGASAGIEDPGLRGARRHADEELASWIEQHRVEEVVERWETNPVFATQGADLVAAQRAGRLNHEPSELARLLRSAGQAAQDPIWHQLGSLEMPVLALAGENDDAYRDAAERIAATVNRAGADLHGKADPLGQAAVILGAGHAAHLERPTAFAATLLAWLERRVLT